MRPEVRLQGFPKRYKDAPECTGDGWLAHYKAATPVIEAGGILVLYGGHGTGKTRMAYELARKAKLPHATCKRGGIDVELPLIYTTAVNLFMSLRDTFRNDSEKSEKQTIKELSDAALLVIDEIQERGETPFEDRKLTQIIDARYMDARPTILISNYSRQDFAKTLSPAVLDRIRENGKGLHFDWPSFRVKVTA
jgi:DNA replication protein DnaC